MNLTDPDGLPSVRSVLDAETAAGPGCGVALSVSAPGVRIDVALGGDGSGSEMTADTVVPWSCSSKPIGALAFAAAWERGAVHPDDPVARHLPDYAAGGKADVRLRDLLTHTTGVPDPLPGLVPEGGGGDDLPPWEQLEPLVWAAIAQTPAERPAGTAMDYCPLSNWVTLDRVLTTVDGTAPGDSYRRTTAALGLSATLGAPGAGLGCTATDEERANLGRWLVAARLPLPGTGVWGTVGDLRTVGEALLGHAPGTSTPPAAATLEAVTATQWVGTSRRALSTTDFDYGLGVMTLTRLFGRTCSFRTFGHAGGNNSSLVVDPRAGLSMGVYWNRRLGDVRAVTRRVALTDALYRDLGLAPGRAAGRLSRSAG